MPDESHMVIVKLKGVPAVAVEGTVTTKCAPELRTQMPLLVPVMALWLGSVAVKVWFPAVFKVALNVPMPFVNELLPGNPAELALVENDTGSA